MDENICEVMRNPERAGRPVLRRMPVVPALGGHHRDRPRRRPGNGGRPATPAAPTGPVPDRGDTIGCRHSRSTRPRTGWLRPAVAATAAASGTRSDQRPADTGPAAPQVSDSPAEHRAPRPRRVRIAIEPDGRRGAARRRRGRCRRTDLQPLADRRRLPGDDADRARTGLSRPRRKSGCCPTATSTAGSRADPGRSSGPGRPRRHC